MRGIDFYRSAHWQRFAAYCWARGLTQPSIGKQFGVSTAAVNLAIVAYVTPRLPDAPGSWALMQHYQGEVRRGLVRNAILADKELDPRWPLDDVKWVK